LGINARRLELGAARHRRAVDDVSALGLFEHAAHESAVSAPRPGRQHPPDWRSNHRVLCRPKLLEGTTPALLHSTWSAL
jgi:hypothetical protein